MVSMIFMSSRGPLELEEEEGGLVELEEAGVGPLEQEKSGRR